MWLIAIGVWLVGAVVTGILRAKQGTMGDGDGGGVVVWPIYWLFIFPVRWWQRQVPHTRRGREPWCPVCEAHHKPPTEWQ